MEKILLDDWRLCTVPHNKAKQDGFAPKTASEVTSSAYGTIKASVPGNFELDLMREGKLPDMYFGTNIFKEQELENLDLWYCTEFDFEPKAGFDAFLDFGGVDTASEIFLDGGLLGTTENMLIPYSFPVDISAGRHSLVVHILSHHAYAENHPIPASGIALMYNFEQLQIRKAPHMFGWDIMPRALSGGLWREVSLTYRPESRIEDTYIYVLSIGKDSADIKFSASFTLSGDMPEDYTVTVSGKCGDSEFRSADRRLYTNFSKFNVHVPSVKLWMPKNYGEQNLYDVTVTLKYKDTAVDEKSFRYGIRTVELVRSSLAGDGGEFCFKINDKKVFLMGTNWVPTDAFPSRNREYTLRGLDMADDLGCNVIRCWGGNIYPDDLLYDYCDEHGILIWQDFSLACGHYPYDPRMEALIEEEAVSVVKRLRLHPSLILWSGDNECDQMVSPGAAYINGHKTALLDPNENRITREIFPRIIRNEDFTRPYLPSSPYVDGTAIRGGKPSEDHLWGPRDFFKGDFYVNSVAHFASEIGYHGCPSPESIAKFISKDSINDFGDGKKCTNPEWLAHCVSPDLSVPDGFVYRNPLMYRQVERLFGTAGRDIETFARQSQISQAEADKFFIEHFRIAKWRRTGLIWWNVIDGWPQISDAVVDWYGCKKLAYNYIKRSQQPFCLMCDEPKDGKLSLVAVNDTRGTVKAEFKVTEITSGKKVLCGACSAEPDENTVLGSITEESGAFYIIEWTVDGKRYVNHYTASIYEGLDYEKHISQLQKAGFYGEFEGF